MIVMSYVDSAPEAFRSLGGMAARRDPPISNQRLPSQLSRNGKSDASSIRPMLILQMPDVAVSQWKLSNFRGGSREM